MQLLRLWTVISTLFQPSDSPKERSNYFFIIFSCCTFVSRFYCCLSAGGVISTIPWTFLGSGGMPSALYSAPKNVTLSLFKVPVTFCSVRGLPSDKHSWGWLVGIMVFIKQPLNHDLRSFYCLFCEWFRWNKTRVPTRAQGFYFISETMTLSLFYLF